MQPLKPILNDNSHQHSLPAMAGDDTVANTTLTTIPSTNTPLQNQDHVTLFREDMTFEELGLSTKVLKALHELAYKHPSLIQAKAIPHVLNEKDVIGTSQTGSGKTAAFALPLITRISQNKEDQTRKPSIHTLILAPTRELAIQIHDSFTRYGKYARVKVACVYGGVSQREQVRQLRQGVHVLVATPGRLLDLHNQGHVNFSQTQVLVLDEADRMLDMGFLPDIKRIIQLLPSPRQTLFFSATMPEQVKQLAREILHNPVNVTINTDQVQVDTINSIVYFVEKTEKLALLKHVLRNEPIHRALIFTRTKRAADRLAKTLAKSTFKAEAIHGDKSQAAREKALRKFKKGQAKILVATDVVARGIDVNNISHVINYELPDEPEMYVHRIGRTGRAGKQGIALSFCSREETGQFASIERLLQDYIPRQYDHPYAMRAPPQQTDLRLEPERPVFQKKRNRKIRVKSRSHKKYYSKRKY